MNILFYDMGSYTYQDTLYYLKQLGHTCKTLYYHFPNKFHDDFFCDRFEKQLQSDSYDAVMSINFFPLVATLCHAHQIPYLAWCYDSPLEEKLEECFSYDTNRIFLFDRIEAEHYQSLGLFPGCITCPWPSIRTGWTDCSFPLHRCKSTAVMSPLSAICTNLPAGTSVFCGRLYQRLHRRNPPGSAAGIRVLFY